MHERTTSPEYRSTQPFDAVLVHAYWLSQAGDEGKVKLGLRSRLAVRAAALFYDKGRGAKNIVLTAGHLWGPNYPSSAQLMADELHEKYHVPREHIVVQDDAYSSAGEITTFLDMAKKRQWSRLLDIAADKHLWTIPGIYKQLGEAVEFKPVEEIIRQKDNRHMQNLVRRLGRSKYELHFMAYEGLVWTAMHFLQDYEKLDARNKEVRIKKGKDAPLPLDVYRL